MDRKSTVGRISQTAGKFQKMFFIEKYRSTELDIFCRIVLLLKKLHCIKFPTTEWIFFVSFLHWDDRNSFFCHSEHAYSYGSHLVQVPPLLNSHLSCELWTLASYGIKSRSCTRVFSCFSLQRGGKKEEI